MCLSRPPLPGSRYAMLALKIFLARLMPHYRVVQGEKTNKGDLKVNNKYCKLYSKLWIINDVDVCKWNVRNRRWSLGNAEEEIKRLKILCISNKSN